MLDNAMKDLIQSYFTSVLELIEDVPFGLTNTSKIITVNHKKYVARIYNNYTKNESGLKFEIELTAFLEAQQLSFKVPFFVTSLNGSKYVRLSNGKFGSVVEFIEGTTPDVKRINDVEEYGRVVGELSAAFNRYDKPLVEKGIEFIKLDSLHPLCTEQPIKNFTDNPPFELDLEQHNLLKTMIPDVYENYNKMDRLPKQLVHHDLIVYNLLYSEEYKRMTGILDFDFAALDVRALELAICINHLLQFEDEHLTLLNVFLKEYAKSVVLTEEEINWIPFLMKMYYVSVLCIYIGQYYSGREVGEYFRFMLNQLFIRTKWLERNEEQLIESLQLIIRE